MKVVFDFLTNPLPLPDTLPTTLCIENPIVYRNTVSALLFEETESANIVFSENSTPIKYKGNVCFIDNIFTLSYPTAMLKKLYESIEKFCHTELTEKTAHLKAVLTEFLDLVVQNFDYDLDFCTDIDLISLFKTQGLKPCSDGISLMENLLNFMLFAQRYTPQKCFVVPNLHLYFSKEELQNFYTDIINNHIRLLVLENNAFFKKSPLENLIICDKDLCEIVAN